MDPHPRSYEMSGTNDRMAGIGVNRVSPNTREFRNPLLRLLGRLGAAVWAQWDELRHTAAVMGTVLRDSVQPRCWGRPSSPLIAE